MLQHLGRALTLLLCLHLTGFLTVEAAHVHPAGAAAADAAAHCELCALPHLPLHTQAAVPLPRTLQAFAAPPPLALSRGVSFVTLDRYSRPPPPAQRRFRTA